MNEIELTSQETNDLYAMVCSPGWRVFSDKVLEAWKQDLFIILSNPENTRDSDCCFKGSIETIYNTISYEHVIKQKVEEKD